jgi:hypothetical protein
LLRFARKDGYNTTTAHDGLPSPAEHENWIGEIFIFVLRNSIIPLAQSQV